MIKKLVEMICILIIFIGKYLWILWITDRCSDGEPGAKRHNVGFTAVNWAPVLLAF
jgi:hypothetical protein